MSPPAQPAPALRQTARVVRGDGSSWDERVAAVWSAATEGEGVVTTIDALAKERPVDDPVALHERASARDFAGRESEAEQPYRRALALGLADVDRRRAVEATVQLASTLRLLGRPGEALEVLDQAPEDLRPEEHDWLTAFRVLALLDLGRADEAARRGLQALAGHLTQYGAVVGRYVAERPASSRGTSKPAADPTAAHRVGACRMDTFQEIAEERRAVADLLAGLTPEQAAAPSLCDAWSVHDVAAHLVVPLEVSTTRFALAMVACRGSFDRANVRLTREVAARPLGEIVELLGRRADTRFTPPGAGPAAPLTDVLVHGLDITWPLGLTRPVREERARTSLSFLTSRAARGLVPRHALDGLRLTAEDVGWSSGDGPAVIGTAEVLLLALTGRPAALPHLHGEGAATLRARLG